MHFFGLLFLCVKAIQCNMSSCKKQTKQNIKTKKKEKRKKEKKKEKETRHKKTKANVRTPVPNVGPESRGGGYSHRNAIRGCAAQMGRFLTKNP